MSELAGPVDTRSRREQTLALAGNVAKSPEPLRRRAVKGLVKERLQLSADDFFDPESCRGRHQNGYPESATEAEIFCRAYGDEGGADYWRAWFFEPMQRGEFIDLLATHGAGTPAQYENWGRLLAETRLTEQCGRCEAEWLLDNPNTTHLVPASLRRWLKPVEPAPAAEPTRQAAPLAPAPAAPTAESRPAPSAALTMPVALPSQPAATPLGAPPPREPLPLETDLIGPGAPPGSPGAGAIVRPDPVKPPSPVPSAAKNGGGRPPAVAAKVAEWFSELPPKDQKLSASKLADSYTTQKLPGSFDHVRKKITKLKAR